MKIVDKNVCILYNLLINQGTDEMTSFYTNMILLT